MSLKDYSRKNSRNRDDEIIDNVTRITPEGSDAIQGQKSSYQQGNDHGSNSFDYMEDDPVNEKAFEEKLAQRREEIRNRHRERSRKRKMKRMTHAFIAVDIILLLVLVVLIGTGNLNLSGLFGNPGNSSKTETTAPVETEAETTAAAEEEPAQALTELIAQSDRQAMMYDYDAAVETLSTSEFSESPEVQAKIQEYEAQKAACVPFDNSQITHVFFHILCVDTERAFTNDAAGKDFNQVMTTIPEFEAIIQQMYDRGYVLVGLHDMAEMQTQEDGTRKMVKKQIMLPEGKKAFVMSEDDVCYYEYMEGKGFADKMVFDENGKLKLQYTDAQGNVSIGDYDIVPILDNFVEAHPDFSYRGAKAIMAFTGYNGVLGYRTDETYDESSENRDPNMKANPNIAEDRETVKKLFQALVDDGYELASHSWGHINFTKRELADLQRDTDRWERNVESLMPGNCDIILYPFGADIGDWHPYSTENDKFNMLKAAGFDYFCNVDSNPVWVQYTEDAVRQGRRNLDGYRLWMDYSGEDNKLSDILDVSTVFDTRRPTPITWN